MQTDNLVVYLTKQPTSLEHIKWLQYHIVLNASFLGTPLPKQGAPVSEPMLPQKGSWMLLWVDKGQVLVFHRAEQTWQTQEGGHFRSFPSSFSSRFPYPSVILFVWSYLGEVPFGPSWRMCLLSLLLSHGILSLILLSPPWQVCPKCGCTPFVSSAPGMVMWQAVLHLFDPTLNVLSFISQAHYLDRVVKGMVFLPLFSYCLCVCVCV